MEDIDLDPTLSITSDLEDYAESIERSNLKWSITDPELIEQILAASSPNRTSMLQPPLSANGFHRSSGSRRTVHRKQSSAFDFEGQ